MKKRLVAAAALALAMPIALGVAAPSFAAPAATVTVKGHILSPSGKPVAGVRVAVRAKGRYGGSLGAGHAFTSRTGRYELQVPPPEPDTLSPAKTYVLRVTDPNGGEWAPTSTTFAAADTTTYREDGVVHHGAKLSGRGYDSSGRTVQAGLVVWAGATMTTTRSDGSYHFTNLPAGRTSVQIASPTSNGNARYYSTATPNGTLEGTDATTLNLGYGTRTTGVSIHFPAVAKITGQVTVNGVKQGGEGQDSAQAVLLDSAGTELALRNTNPTFSFRDLPAGTYYLLFRDGGGDDPSGIVTEYYRDSTTLAGATPITVQRGGAVTRLVADLATKS